MPLIEGKSPKSFSKNVETEMHHGKPLKQSLAIAYHMKKKAQKHHMAHGGHVDHCAEGCDMLHEHKFADGGEVPENQKKLAAGLRGIFGGGEEAHAAPVPTPEPKHDENPTSQSMKKAFHTPGYAEGGEVEDMPPLNDDEDLDMIGHIMKMRAHKYSKGGQVANATPPIADGESAEYDDLVLRDDLEEHYTGANSGDELGDAEHDEENHDTVSQVMKSRKKKDKMPRPA